MQCLKNEKAQGAVRRVKVSAGVTARVSRGKYVE